MIFIINLLLKRWIPMENQNISEQTTASVPVNDAIEQGPDEAQQIATQQTATPQTSTDTTVAQQQPQTATDKYYYMTPDGIAMYVIPKKLIGKYSYKELTGGNAQDGIDFEDGTRKNTKEPQTKHTAVATFNFEELQKFFKVVKVLGVKYIKISLATNEPVKITAANDNNEEVSYWLAPYMTE
jgi:hypothetical protein